MTGDGSPPSRWEPEALPWIDAGLPARRASPAGERRPGELPVRTPNPHSDRATPAPDELPDEGDQGDDEQEVDQTSAYRHDERAEQPEDHEYDGDCCEHETFPQGREA